MPILCSLHGARTSRRSAHIVTLLAVALWLASFAACDLGTLPSSVVIAVRGGLPADGKLTTDDGVVLQVHRADLAVLAAELVPCADAGPTVDLRALLRPAVAHAHSAGSATRIGVPHILDLRSSTPTTLGELAPPAGSYCSVRLSLGPADADAVGLPSPAFAGTTLALDGELEAPVARPVLGTCATSVTANVALAPTLLLAEGEDVRIDIVLGDADSLSTLEPGEPSDDALTASLLLGARDSAQASLAR